MNQSVLPGFEFLLMVTKEIMRKHRLLADWMKCS